MPGTCNFPELWLQNDDLKDGVLRVDDRKDKCKVCKTNIDISNVREGALHRLINGKTHAACMKSTGASSFNCALCSSSENFKFCIENVCELK